MRINASGNTLWTAAGVPICTQSSNQNFYTDGTHPYMVSDGAGGATERTVQPGINEIKLKTGNLARGIYEVELSNSRNQYHVRMMKE